MKKRILLIKLSFLMLFLTFSINIASARGLHVGIFFGGGPIVYGAPMHYAPPQPVYYYPDPYYYDYGPPVHTYVRWIPEHYNRYGYWVPGQYVRYYA